jgi:hypothetical protein
LAKSVKNDPDFNDVGLFVDVFHFLCKHLVTDEFSQTHCNPAHFSELLGKDSYGWYFNSSIAEQTNVWLSGIMPFYKKCMLIHTIFFLTK